MDPDVGIINHTYMLALGSGAVLRKKVEEGIGQWPGMVAPDQGRTPTCFANAIAAAITGTEARIIGRIDPSCAGQPSEEKFGERFAMHRDRMISKHGTPEGAKTSEVIEVELPALGLRSQALGNNVDAAMDALSGGRMVLMRFELTKGGWDNFSSHAERTPEDPVKGSEI